MFNREVDNTINLIMGITVARVILIYTITRGSLSITIDKYFRIRMCIISFSVIATSELLWVYQKLLLPQFTIS